jgi:uncharacterized protein (TIGR02246 family)
MEMKTRILAVVLFVALVLFAACAQKVNDSADIKAINEAVQAYVKGYNARDAGAVASLMTDDVVFVQGNKAVAAGKEEAQKLLQAVLAQLEPFDIELVSTIADIQVRGDIGVARGAYTFKGTDKTGLLAPLKETGNWTCVYKRQGDGSWKEASLIGSSTDPLPGTTANGADEQALIQIEQDLAAAMAKGDTAALDPLIAKEWIYMSAQGKLQTKAQFLNELKTTYKLTSVAMKNLSAHVFGDHAIVSMIGELKGTYNGKDVSSSENSVDYFIRRDGRWQMVYTQNTPLKP